MLWLATRTGSEFHLHICFCMPSCCFTLDPNNSALSWLSLRSHVWDFVLLINRPLFEFDLPLCCWDNFILNYIMCWLLTGPFLVQNASVYHVGRQWWLEARKGKRPNLNCLYSCWWPSSLINMIRQKYIAVPVPYNNNDNHNAIIDDLNKWYDMLYGMVCLDMFRFLSAGCSCGQQDSMLESLLRIGSRMPQSRLTLGLV